MRNLDLTPLFRSTVGFDQLDKLFDAAFRDAARDISYPPYNIVKLGQDQYRITMAVAGFTADAIEIVAYENTLTVKGALKQQDKDAEYLHRGIAQRAFEHRFQLADHVRVSGADLSNGLLHISLVREVPEAMKPRKIAINGSTTAEPKVIEGGAEKAETKAA